MTARDVIAEALSVYERRPDGKPCPLAFLGADRLIDALAANGFKIIQFHAAQAEQEKRG